MSLDAFDTDARLQAVFRDSYALEAEKLESLYSKSKRHQWNAELDVDWSVFEPDVDVIDRSFDLLSRLRTIQELPDADRDRLFKAANLYLISQILHGEQAALMTCGQLVNSVPEMDGKFAAAVQVMDEARHVEVFARYLDCHGTRFPIDPDLQAIIVQLLGEADWEAQCVGMQVILESLALSFFRAGEQMAVEPVFRQFIGRVHEDESRHVAYGVLTLETRIPELAPDARRRLEDFSYDAVTRIAGRAGKPSFSGQIAALATTGLDVKTLLPKVIDELSRPDEIDWSGLMDPIRDTVLPNLLRVGLVPERLLQGYLAQGWRIDPRAGTLEDLHTWHPDTQAARADFAERGRDFSRPEQASL